MTKQQYEKISQPFRSEKYTKWLNIANKAITSIGYTSYPLILIYLFFVKFPITALYATVVPASGFILLTFVRKAINRPRPYETLDIDPLIKKNTKGNSMPSRHVFSMTIIAVTSFLIHPALGCGLMALSIMLCFVRVIGGVHYPSDVAAGFLSAVIWGVVLYMVVL